MVLCQIGSVPDGKEMARWHGTLAWDPSRQDSGTRLYTVISNLHTGPCIAYSIPYTVPRFTVAAFTYIPHDAHARAPCRSFLLNCIYSICPLTSTD